MKVKGNGNRSVKWTSTFQKCKSKETSRSQSLQVEEKATDGAKHQFSSQWLKNFSSKQMIESTYSAQLVGYRAVTTTTKIRSSTRGWYMQTLFV